MGLSNYFTFSVDVGFDGGPFTASPTWTEVTDDVLAGEGVTFSRGSRSVGSRPGPGLADLTVKNWAEGSKVAGRWTPGVAAGPWHPLSLKRRLRVEVQYASTWYSLWGGHITDFTPGWVGAGKATCGLSCSDLLAALGRAKPFPVSTVLAEQLSDSPVLCYPLDEPEGSTSAGNRSPYRAIPLAVTINGGGAVDFGAGAFGPDAESCAAFTPSGGDFAYLRAVAPIGVDPLGPTSAVGVTAEAYVRPTVAATAGVLAVASADLNGQVALGTSAAGKATANVVDLAHAVTANLTGTSTLPTDSFTHIAVTQSISGSTVTVELWVNGSSEASTTYTAPSIVGTGAASLVSVGAAVFDGQIAGVATYATALSSGRIADHAAAVNGWTGESTDTRFARLCRLYGIPSGLYASSAGAYTAGAQAIKDKALTAALNEVADVERGSIAVDRDGKLHFYPATSRRGATAAVTLDARTDVLNRLDGLAYNDDDLVNDATVTRVGGATQRAVNQASIDAYGSSADSADVIAETDDDAQHLAEWMANYRADPAIKAPTLRVSMLNLAVKSSSKVAAMCALELGQRITVTNLPAGLPSTTLDLFVEGISDEVTADDWVRTITTSSLTRGGAVWVLGDSTYSVLGSTTILA